jgi:hypothetical protein
VDLFSSKLSWYLGFCIFCWDSSPIRVSYPVSFSIFISSFFFCVKYIIIVFLRPLNYSKSEMLFNYRLLSCGWLSDFDCEGIELGFVFGERLVENVRLVLELEIWRVFFSIIISFKIFEINLWFYYRTFSSPITELSFMRIYGQRVQVPGAVIVDGKHYICKKD